MTQTTTSLDPEQLRYYRTYFTDYFQDEFRLGMGTEHILDALAQADVSGDWIDLGAGPCTLFWSIPLTGVHTIASADAAPEALAVLKEFVASDSIPLCYEQVLQRYGRGQRHLERMRGALREYHAFDAMCPWPAEFENRRFGLVTEFGLFGLAPSAEEYRACFRPLRAHLRPGGKVVAADWIRSASFIASEGHDNTYLTEELIADAADAAGLRLVSSRYCPISGDDLYDALIVWSAEPAH